MQKFDNIEEFNNYYISLYSGLSSSIDFVSLKMYKQLDTTVVRDYKRSLKLFKKQEKMRKRVLYFDLFVENKNNILVAKKEKKTFLKALWRKRFEFLLKFLQKKK